MKTLLAFLIIFSIIVVIHEYGHFYFARKAGILVREFSIGMGPKLFSKQGKDGTTYTLRMLPLGGYVRLAGLNEEESVKPGMEVGILFNEKNEITQINTSEKQYKDELPFRIDQVDLARHLQLIGYPINQTELESFNVARNARVIEADGTNVPIAFIENTYEMATPLNKIRTNIAGPINNFILSIVVFTLIGFLVPGVQDTSSTIGKVIENTPASQVGLMSQDKVIEVNQEPVNSWNELVEHVSNSAGKTVTLEIERQDQVITKKVKVRAVKDPKSGKTYGQLGIQANLKKDVGSRILFGFTQTWAIITSVISVLSGMFSKGFDINQFGGPVAMAQMTGEVVRYGFITTLGLMAALSANLGVFNLLPIPALDGGKIVLNLYELVRGKPLSQEKEGIITIIGVALLFLLMVAVTWNDIARYFMK